MSSNTEAAHEDGPRRVIRFDDDWRGHQFPLPVGDFRDRYRCRAFMDRLSEQAGDLDDWLIPPRRDEEPEERVER